MEFVSGKLNVSSSAVKLLEEQGVLECVKRTVYGIRSRRYEKREEGASKS